MARLDSQFNDYCKSLMLGSVLFVASLLYPTHGWSNEIETIAQKYLDTLVGRSFKSDEGTIIRYGKLVTPIGSIYRYSVPFKTQFSDGFVSLASENLWIGNHGQILVDQLVEGVVTRRYEVSIEGQSQAHTGILRIKPYDRDHINFIARECLQPTAERPGVCFLKLRFLQDVIVTRFNEFSN